MSDLQGTPDEVEQSASESEGSSNKTDFWTKVSTALFVSYMGYEMYRVIKRDELLKVSILFYTQRLLKATALMFGTAALLVEKEYNDYVATLH